MSQLRTTHHVTNLTSGERISYRSAGPVTAPTILLLHGFPTNSHQYRQLIPVLAAQNYRVLAPDLPGFGFTTVPEGYQYTFENLAKTTDAWLKQLPQSPVKFAIYIFDYGAPVGLRLALSNPHAITAIVSQNGNAYEEGLLDAWSPIKQYWSSGAAADRASLTNLLSTDMVKWQYETGTKDLSVLKPETYTLDAALLTRPGIAEAQLDLVYDYRNNVALYPQFQAWFRESNVPLLAVWGDKDPFFGRPELFKRDLPNAEVHLLDAGHFALESNLHEVIAFMIPFLQKVYKLSPPGATSIPN